MYGDREPNTGESRGLTQPFFGQTQRVMTRSCNRSPTTNHLPGSNQLTQSDTQIFIFLK